MLEIWVYVRVQGKFLKLTDRPKPKHVKTPYWTVVNFVSANVVRLYQLIRSI